MRKRLLIAGLATALLGVIDLVFPSPFHGQVDEVPRCRNTFCTSPYVCMYFSSYNCSMPHWGACLVKLCEP